ncbi:MAG: response regulator, partial [bacterium]|nr:response regulator [bacterium]
KLLIVEDEKILSEMYCDTFIKQGYDVCVAPSAEEGLDAIVKELPDFILLDILLPRSSGVEFLRELRKNSRTKNIPVLAFSNYDDPKTKEEMLRLGALDYLIKTAHTPQELVSIVQKHL